MVNETSSSEPGPGGADRALAELRAAMEAERRLILSYASPSTAPALAALLALDAALSHVLRTTSEPVLGQMRLQWWRDSLHRLDSAPAPAEPVLRQLEADALSRGLTGAAMAPMADGWEELLLAETMTGGALQRYAAGRGVVFVLAGAALGAKPSDPLEQAGQGWALADLARHLRHGAEADAARAAAEPLLAQACGVRWSGGTRALGAMAHLARRDLALAPGVFPPVGAPSRLARLLWHRISGR